MDLVRSRTTPSLIHGLKGHLRVLELSWFCPRENHILLRERRVIRCRKRDLGLGHYWVGVACCCSVILLFAGVVRYYRCYLATVVCYTQRAEGLKGWARSGLDWYWSWERLLKKVGLGRVIWIGIGNLG